MLSAFVVMVMDCFLLAGGEDEDPVSIDTRRVDKALSGLEFGQCSGPLVALARGVLGLRADRVVVLRESGEGFVEAHGYVEREGDPVFAEADGDGVIGGVDGLAFQRDFAGVFDFNHVHL